MEKMKSTQEAAYINPNEHLVAKVFDERMIYWNPKGTIGTNCTMCPKKGFATKGILDEHMSESHGIVR